MSIRKSNDRLIKSNPQQQLNISKHKTINNLQSTHNMNLSKSIQLSAALLLITAVSSASAAHVQCNTHDDIGSCPSTKMSYVCEDGQNIMCCTWSELPIVRNQRMQRRVDGMTSEIDLPKYGNCQHYTYTEKQSTTKYGYGKKKQHEYDTLTGTSWVATEIKYPHGRMRRVLNLPIRGYEPSLIFNEDGTYTANGGCIESSGKVDMSTSEFDLNEISAVMTCDDIRVDNQERAFEEAVLNQDRLQYSIDQQVLTLYDEEGEMVASFVPLEKKSKKKKKKGGHLRAVLQA